MPEPSSTASAAGASAVRDDEDDGPDDGREDTGAAPGAIPEIRRYITGAGLARFRAEFAALLHGERPKIVEIVSWAAGNGDRSENGDYQYGKRRLREIDRRLRFLDRRIRGAIVVEPAAQTRRDRVFFGATVTYAGAGDDDAARTVTILGVDEADTARGEVSLASPVARALLGAFRGDEVELRMPGGSERIEVIAITYPSPPPSPGPDPTSDD